MKPLLWFFSLFAGTISLLPGSAAAQDQRTVQFAKSETSTMVEGAAGMQDSTARISFQGIKKGQVLIVSARSDMMRRKTDEMHIATGYLMLFRGEIPDGPFVPPTDSLLSAHSFSSSGMSDFEAPISTSVSAVWEANQDYDELVISARLRSYYALGPHLWVSGVFLQ